VFPSPLLDGHLNVVRGKGTLLMTHWLMRVTSQPIKVG
jgi:hypothetical protein